MIKDVDQISVADIFSINNNSIYTIPKYQREYTWGINNWDALFNDVTENEEGYFLGSYICVSGGTIGLQKLEVIDGQQRFATIMLLLIALYEKLATHSMDMDEDDKIDFANLRSLLANQKKTYSLGGGKTLEYEQRLFLQKQSYNAEDFAYILYSKGIITAVKPKQTNFGNRRIAKAYKHFCVLIDDEIREIKKNELGITDVGALFKLVNKFCKAILVGIEVDSNKDAYMLFESLNHRGVPLSALDLIKNTLIAQAESDENADNAYEQWKQILNYINPDEYSVQERFFRQYYNAFRDELNAPYDSTDKKYYFGYLATRTSLLDIYEKMIKKDYGALLTDLSLKAKEYSVLVNNSEEEYEYSSSLQDLERISGAPSYILLLYLFSNKNELGLSDDSLNDIVKILIVFFVHRNVTDVPNTRKLTQLFIDIIAIVKQVKGNVIVEKVRMMLKGVSSSDEDFEQKLRGAIYDENPDAARFILCSIEEQNRTREIYSDLWSRDNSHKYIWTIEHIFPEGKNVPTEWVQMIADGDANKAKEYLDVYTHTLGNLTLTGYNQNLSNFSFEKKKTRKSKDGSKKVGYENGLFLNSDVVNQDKWTIEKIEQRTDKLVKMTLELFAL